MVRVRVVGLDVGERRVGVAVSDATRTQFEAMFPGRDARTDLDAWGRFEQAHPDTFLAMYSFWCCPA